jgi:hypothetical protein
MDGLAFEHSTIKSRFRTGHEGPVSHKSIELARMSMAAGKSGFPALSLADSWFLVADPLLGAGLFF